MTTQQGAVGPSVEFHCCLYFFCISVFLVGQVYVGQPSVVDTISILRGLKETYEAHHGVHLLDAALISAAQLADRWERGSWFSFVCNAVCTLCILFVCFFCFCVCLFFCFCVHVQISFKKKHSCIFFCGLVIVFSPIGPDTPPSLQAFMYSQGSRLFFSVPKRFFLAQCFLCCGRWGCQLLMCTF